MAGNSINDEYEDDEDSMSEWSDEEIERTIFFYSLFFLLLAIVSYLIVLRPQMKQNQRRGDSNSQEAASIHTQELQQRNNGSSPQQQNIEISNDGSVSIIGSRGNSNRSLVNGIYPFSYLRMKRRLSSLKNISKDDCISMDPDMKSDNRKTISYDEIEEESYQVLLKSKLVVRACIDANTSDVTGAMTESLSKTVLPFKRGGIVVISVRPSELYSSAFKSKTTFDFISAVGIISSLFLIVDFSPDTNTNKDTLFAISDSLSGKMDQIENIKRRIRESGGISEDILPSHRIVVCQSATGRVAFVRQICPDFVLDYDAGVQKDLHRFGFQTQLYGNAHTADQASGNDEVDLVKPDVGKKLFAINNIGDFIS
mmetsp:Transcript_62077/g.72579  ORF Transcript_62077/g.72579 Transcript_62077/m.72579 type:complete len:369 (+) Transcript_62077:189-1295(+)